MNNKDKSEGDEKEQEIQDKMKNINKNFNLRDYRRAWRNPKIQALIKGGKK